MAPRSTSVDDVDGLDRLVALKTFQGVHLRLVGIAALRMAYNCRDCRGVVGSPSASATGP